MEKGIARKFVQGTEEGGQSKGKEKAVGKESEQNRGRVSKEYSNSEETEGDIKIDRRGLRKGSDSIERSVEGGDRTDRQDTQRQTEVEQVELVRIEKEKDRLEVRKSYGREQDSKGEETVSECTSIDLLDIKELDRWLEKLTGKLSLKEKEETDRKRENKEREKENIIEENQIERRKEKGTVRDNLDIQRGQRTLQYESEQLEGEPKKCRVGNESRSRDREDRTREEERERREEGQVKSDSRKGRTEARKETQRSRIEDERNRVDRYCGKEEVKEKEGEDIESSGRIELQRDRMEESRESGREREDRGGEKNKEQGKKVKKREGRESGNMRGKESRGEIVVEEIGNGGVVNQEQEEQTGEYAELLRQERESISTTSSVAALFWEKGLESGSKTVGRKKITRRKVWERWRRIVRGEIRKRNKKKTKIERVVNKEKEENRLVFDYTSHGLSEEETQLLERGEAFCVADYKLDEDRNRVDIYNFQRRLRLHEFFRDPGHREGEEEEGRGTQGERRGNLDSRGGRGSTVQTGTRGSRNSVLIGNREVEEGRGTQRERRENLVRTGERDSVVQTGRRVSRSSVVPRNGGRDSRNGGRNVREEIGTRRQTPERRRTIIGGRGRESIVFTGERGNTNRNSVVMVGSRRERGSERNRIESGLGEHRRESSQRRERNEGEKEVNRKLPSIYDPDSKNRNLNRYNACIQEEIMLSMEKKVKFRDNIAKVERKALKLLKSRIEKKEIIITRADKGSGLVAVDYNIYISKGTKYIEEEAGVYEKVQEEEKDIIDRLGRERNKIVEQLKEEGVIPIQTATYIKKQLEEKITGIKFYYKIHKDRNIDTMPLRPLQSCIKAPMQYLSIVLTDILQPLLTYKNIPSFIFDSNQLLYRLRRLSSIPDGCTLISSDVSALYPSIPHREGFRAMRIFLQEKTTYSTTQIDTIIRALEIVITDNYMTWNKQIYKQTSGVAMGTPVAVAYANIFMDWVDKQVRQKAPYIYEHIRFIDDNLFIIPEDRVEDLIEIANSILPPYIKFTYEKLEQGTGKGLPFLDTQLFISKDKRIKSRLYTKKTDRHAYLLPSSYHPPHITQNIPMAVFGRIRKICSTEEWFREDAEKAEGWLLNRGYKGTEVKKAIEKTKQKDRWNMIEQIEQKRHTTMQKEEGEVVDIPLIITFNQHGGRIKKVLRDRQPLLDSAFRKTKVRPRISYRRRRNLNDIVVQKGLRGPLEDNNEALNVFSECGEKPGYRNRCPCKGKHSHVKCRCCMHRQREIEGVESKLYKPVNCNSKNIVYIIGCKECSKKYIGETQQRLKDRLAQHMYNIDKLNQPVYLHFKYVHKLENLYIGILETVRGVEPFMRKVREAWWINHLKTLEPRGFNVKLECNQVYEATS